jgi:nucleoside-diphosphate-sugar epimerase
MTRKRVLVLGGSGFVGGYLRDELASGYEVETTSSTGQHANYAFDLLRREHHALLLRGGWDAVVNCSVRRTGALAELFDVNVRGLAELAFALKDTRLHFVQVSTLLAAPENRHLGDYGLTKFLADELLLQCSRSGSLRPAILRFAQIFDLAGKSASSQPGLHHWVSQIRRREPIEVFTGSAAKRSYLPVQLVARAVRHCLDRELVGVHDVIAPEAFTPLELARLLAQHAGYGQEKIRLSSSKTPASYFIPGCSPEYRSWFAEQKTCSEYFRRLMQDG